MKILSLHKMIIFKLFLESVSFAIHSLTSNKLRSFLSLAGVSIGIFAIISVLTIVDSLEINVRKSFSALGNDLIYVQKWPWSFGSDYPWWKYMNRPQPSYKEMEAIQRKSQSSTAAAFMLSTNNRNAKHENQVIEKVNILCVSHEYDKVRTFELSSGRYFTETESNTGKGLALIGKNIENELYGDGSGLEKDIILVGRKLKVIGVFKKEGESIIGNSPDNQVVIPINYARKIIDIKSERLHPMIIIKSKIGVSNDELKDELKGILRSERRLSPREEENFALNEANLLSNQLDSIFRIIKLAGWIIGGFSILVGGFGIANIMFVSVKERTGIIGIQKAIGAKNYLILFQFLTESVILCASGGVLGLIFIFPCIFFVERVFEYNISLGINNILLGICVSIVIGVISGIIPAYSASKLDPVEAIRKNG